jgi:hypothetical protein
MTDIESYLVSVERRIAAPAPDIFRVLCDPVRHLEFDGSGMLRVGTASPPVTQLGDTFQMEMHFSQFGDYRTINYIVEFEQDRLIAWAPSPLDEKAVAEAGVSLGTALGHRWVFELTPDGPDATVVTERYDCSRAGDAVKERVDGGRAWMRAMATSLERLDHLCSTLPRVGA